MMEQAKDELEQQANLIRTSDLFDAAWYIARYPDVALLDVDPALHYLRWGAKIGRNPTAAFDTTYYLRNYKDVARSGQNPFVHYLKYGQKEGRSPRVGVNEGASNRASRLITLMQKQPLTRAIESSKIRCTIVLTVYNAHDEVLDCIHGILRYTEIGQADRLLILDDSSPDPRMRNMLAEFADVSGIEIVHNPVNLGYTANVNQGCRMAGDDDVVLLNSDTVVGPHWLRNLKQAAYQAEHVGTVTAVSNNAGAFSVPRSGTNHLPAGVDVDAIARVVADTTGSTTFEVPTGNGFCLYIKRSLLREIGSFDVEAFPRGYGEENDFCMRAVESGWANLIAPRVYVAHVRSASFKDKKNDLIDASGRVVGTRHPAYEGAIKAIGTSPTFIRLRKEVADALKAGAVNLAGMRPRILFVLSTRTGGTPQTNRDLMNAISDIYDCYALRCDRNTIEVLESTEADYRILKTWRLADPVTFATHVSLEYDEIVRSILVDLSIDLLHIRHLAWHSLHLPEVAKSVGIPVVNSFHDFYTVCPSINLIDQEGRYFPTGVSENGLNWLWRTDVTALPVTRPMLDVWQRRMQRALSWCDAFVTTCQTARDLICQSLPDIGKRCEDFHVIPHGRDFDRFDLLAVDEEIGQGNPLRVLVPGNIGLSKGKEFIKQIKQSDVHGLIEFHVLGNSSGDLKPWIIHHGEYKREQFRTLVASIRPHIAAVLSIWPETYCHTLTESWACGLPVLGVEMGAVAERLSRHGGGWLVEPDVDAIRKRLLELRQSQEERRNKVRLVRKWQGGYGRENTTAKMSERYLALYQHVMARSRMLSGARRKRIGFVMKGRFPAVPATAYVRLVDWKGWFEKSYGEPVDFLHWSALLRSELLGYSAVVVQRDAIPVSRVEAVLGAIKRSGVQLVFELDDNLFEVPPEGDLDGTYAGYRKHLSMICRGADQVHVTNEALRTVCSQYNANVLIRPNRLQAERWGSDSEEGGVQLPDVDPNALNVLYFGSRTHVHDLEFAISAMELVRRRGVRVDLHVVGVPCPDGGDAGWIHLHVPPSSRYDRFVQWLRAIGGTFDLGIAPLVDTRFAATKSYLKAIEYCALGLPVLCSDQLPYSDLSTSKIGDAITLLPNNLERWADAFQKTTKLDPSRRSAIREQVQSFWIPS